MDWVLTLSQKFAAVNLVCPFVSSIHQFPFLLQSQVETGHTWHSSCTKTVVRLCVVCRELHLMTRFTRCIGLALEHHVVCFTQCQVKHGCILGSHLSSAEIDNEFCTFPCQNVHLSIGEEFCTFPCQNVHLSIGEEFCTFPCQKCAPLSRTPLLNGAEFALSVAKYVALFETVRILRRFCQMTWQGIEAPKQTIEFPAAPSFFSSKKWIKLIPKTIGNWKRDCAWGCARGINTTWENLQIEKHKSGRRPFRSSNWFVLFDLQIFSGGVYPPSAISRTISFSISNSFWY